MSALANLSLKDAVFLVLNLKSGEKGDVTIVVCGFENYESAHEFVNAYEGDNSHLYITSISVYGFPESIPTKC